MLKMKKEDYQKILKYCDEHTVEVFKKKNISVEEYVKDVFKPNIIFLKKRMKEMAKILDYIVERNEAMLNITICDCLENCKIKGNVENITFKEDTSNIEMLIGDKEKDFKVSMGICKMKDKIKVRIEDGEDSYERSFLIVDKKLVSEQFSWTFNDCVSTAAFATYFDDGEGSKCNVRVKNVFYDICANDLKIEQDEELELMEIIEFLIFELETIDKDSYELFEDEIYDHIKKFVTKKTKVCVDQI